MNIPRLLIAGLRGGSGKTFISLGLAAAWRKKGYLVAPFKKGPDYIDAAWLSRAAGSSCRNLDLFLMSPQTVLTSFARSAGQAQLSVIEGNRGLYDGMDPQGTWSTAELAKLLQTPVILVVDCTKATRTVAALVLGCQRLDPQVLLGGVILNQTASSRHESVVRQAVEQSCAVPVLGAVPKIPDLLFTERHLGLVPPQEHEHWDRALEQAARAAEQYLNLNSLENLARQAPLLEVPDPNPRDQDRLQPEAARIGVFRDAAFQFYYPENLEALSWQGARLVDISPLCATGLPEVDALYIGGGFPETLAPVLAENQPFLQSLRRAIEKGLPVYAECGGAVFLGEKLLYREKSYTLAGVLPVVFAFGDKPRGHGYAVLETVGHNPFYAVGQAFRAHEFHYTYMLSAEAQKPTFALRVLRGYGFDGQWDGLCYRNVLASYMHVHALGTEDWAPALVQAAVRFRSPRKNEDPQIGEIT
jgi:cobyrinic acid a,c-diamide synthase